MPTRIPAKPPATLLPVRIAGLGDLHLETYGRILDESQQSVRIGVLDEIPVGSQVRIELEDSVWFGEVRYCESQTSWFALGLVRTS